LVLEALDQPDLADAVMYLHHPDRFTPSLANDLQNWGSRAVVVVDETTRRDHQRLDHAVVPDGRVKVITLGETGSLGMVSQVVALDTMTADEIEHVLRSTYPQLTPQMHKVVVRTSGGNVDYALKIAAHWESSSETGRAAMLTATGVADMLRVTVPAGTPFIVAQAMALLRRVGSEGGIEEEARALASFAGVTEDDFAAAVLVLEQHGVVRRHGRYRAVAPFPLAVALAADVWQTRSADIVANLLPVLPAPALESLLGRAADLGRLAETEVALGRLLAEDGPFGSLEALELPGRSGFLPALAVVDRVRTLSLLDRIAALPLPELAAAVASRRDLVWAAEKLAWHSATFERSALVLLRLALAENEHWANNATGQFVALFGTRLPATAARPSDRITFLSTLFGKVLEDPSTVGVPAASSRDAADSVLDGADRSRAAIVLIDAAASALDWTEMRTASADEQYGEVVEPAGTPATAEEDLTYRRSAIDLLCAMASRSAHLGKPRPLPDSARTSLQQEPQTPARTAIRAVLDHASPWLGTPLEPAITAAIATLAPIEPASVRDFIRDATSVFADRVTPEGRSELESVAASLTLTDPLDRFADLARREPWQDTDLTVIDEMTKTLGAIHRAERWPDLVAQLATGRLTDNWTVGRALALYDGVPTTPDTANGEVPTPILSRMEMLATAISADRTVPSWFAAYVDSVFGAWASSTDRLLDKLASAHLTDSQLARLALYAPPTPAAVRYVEAALRAGVPTSAFWQASAGRRWLAKAPLQDAVALLATINHESEDAAGIWIVTDMLDALGKQWHQADRLPANDPHLQALTSLELRTIGDLPVLRRINGTHLWQRVVSRLLPGQAASIVDSLVHQIAAGHAVRENDPSGEVLNAASAADPLHAITQVVQAADADQGWRVLLSLRPWWLPAIPPNIVEQYLADTDPSVLARRTRRVAELAPAGEEQPSPYAVMLLDRVPNDERVAAAVAGNFMSGTWWGPESERIKRQIGWLAGWTGSQAVRLFAQRLRDDLQRRLAQVLREESEEDSEE
jgi:hypothetical protein